MKNTLSFSLSLIGKLCANCSSSFIVLLFVAFMAIPQFSYAQISGTPSVCAGANRTLTDGMAGPTWSSSNSAIATVGSSSGIVHGVTAGTVHIYCTNGTINDTVSFNVNPNPAPITGSTILYGPPLYIYGGVGTLADATPGGTWSSSNTAEASIGAATGIAYGMACGNPIFTYTLLTGCFTSQLDTVICGLGTAWAYSSITGASIPICVGSSVTLADTAAGGYWESGNTAIATIGSSSGILTGVAAGTCSIVYVLGSSYAYTTVTVGAAPASITGINTLCIGTTTTLSDATPGGTWSSSLSVATVGTSGTVLGVTSGNATITYTASTGCHATRVVTVNPSPTVYIVSGGGSYCAGGTGLHIGLGGSTSGISYQLYEGTTSDGLPVTGTGLPLDFGLQTGAGTYTVVARNPTTTCSDTMSLSVTITVNPLPALFTGPTAFCVGGTGTFTTSPAGGTWTSSATTVATVGTSGIITGIAAGSATISYTLPVTGCYTSHLVNVTTSPCPLSIPAVCLSTPAILTDCISGGVWSSSTSMVATIGSLTGLVTGAAVGIDTITYSLGTTGCTVTATLSVITAPAGISGPTSTCAGSTISLSDATPSGTWSSGNTAIATVSASGVVTGVTAGVVTISYTIGSCSATKIVTIYAIPATIGGPSSVCMGSTITETDTSAGGSWSVAAVWLATVGSATGIVTGVGAGTTTISYSAGGCSATRTITINAASPITGFAGMCVGASATLSDPFTGGTWSSSATGIATVTGSTGVVNGVSAGTSVITYIMPAGCYVTTTVTVSPYPGPVSAPLFLCNDLVPP